MWVPQSFFKQGAVLIADQQSFPAAYLAQTLRAMGCKVIGPFTSRGALEDWASEDHERLSAAIVALDWLGDTLQPVLARLKDPAVPYLLVDNAPWRHLSAVQASFTWPYAAFQVLEALQNAALQSSPPAEHS